MSETMLAAAPTAAALSSFPKCGTEAHYRWAQEVAVDLQKEPVSATTVGTILNNRGCEEDLEGHSPDPEIWCGDRIAGEEKVYRLTAWVRRIKEEEDGDWHVEVTSAKTSQVSRCVTVDRGLGVCIDQLMDRCQEPDARARAAAAE